MDEQPNRIRELRLARGWSQQQLADRVPCSKMQISGLERGKPKLDVEWMQRLAKPLGCDPSDLLNDRDNPWRLSPDERELLTRYRQADKDRQEDLQRVSDALVPFRHKKRENDAA